jgi:hypothetical protein
MSSNILHDKYLTAIEESAEASYRHRFEISEKAEVLLRDHGSFWEILDDIAERTELAESILEGLTALDTIDDQLTASLLLQKAMNYSPRLDAILRSAAIRKAKHNCLETEYLLRVFAKAEATSEATTS